MTTTPLEDIDPATFVTDALEHFPNDPAIATAEDLALLDAIAEGVHRHALDVRRGFADLGAALLAGELDRTDADDRLAELRERHESCCAAARIVDGVTQALVAAGRLTVLNPGDAHPVVAITHRTGGNL